MQNNQTIAVAVVVDVDRKSELYSLLAVQALDPTRRGPGDMSNQTLTEADQNLSRSVAVTAVKHLLTLVLPPDYGATTVRIKSPKNVKESFESDYEETGLKDAL